MYSKISTANVVTRTVSGDDIRSDNDSFSSPSPSEDRRSRSSSEAKSFGRAMYVTITTSLTRHT